MSSQEKERENSQNYLKIQQRIRQVEDQLVTAIQKALDNSKYPKAKLEESQFRNLLRVASTTQRPEVIENFLLYQVGRDKKWGRGKDSLAQVIIHDINHLLKNLAEEIARKNNYSDSIRIWIQLIRLYLGYGFRYLTYLNKGKTDGDD